MVPSPQPMLNAKGIVMKRDYSHSMFPRVEKTIDLYLDAKGAGWLDNPAPTSSSSGYSESNTGAVDLYYGGPSAPLESRPLIGFGLGSHVAGIVLAVLGILFGALSLVYGNDMHVLGWAIAVIGLLIIKA